MNLAAEAMAEKAESLSEEGKDSYNPIVSGKTHKFFKKRKKMLKMQRNSRRKNRSK